LYTPIEKIRDVFPFDPFKAIVAPRPIGWISTISKAGIPNIAPYSFFGAVSSDPNMLGFTSSGIKDTLENCRETGEFVFNVVSGELLEAMNQTAKALGPDESEFDFVSLEKAGSHLVKPPRVADSPAALECKVVSIRQLDNLEGGKTESWFTIGQVVGVYINPKYITTDKRFDTAKARIPSRCGYMDYMSAGEVFELLRP
jgi:flavin reductase (DIM6/NTAB) family NADH-FMN oxidoreductase RutF|tara:strand:+ start:9767 stop:10366 length:600 start_codon:yes stop_codon:yes gene_type:complete